MLCDICISHWDLTQRLMVMNCERIVFNHGDLFRKVILNMIKFSRPFLVGWSEETLKLMRAITENIARCNIIFSDLDYFRECYWSGCRPIANSKSKWFNPCKSMDCCYWSLTLERWVKTPSAVWNHPQGTTKFTRLDYRHQRTAPPAVTILHGRWLPTNHGDDS